MHIGNKIKEEVAKRNISVTDFAKLISNPKKQDRNEESK